MTVPQDHLLANTPGGVSTSSYAQELMCFFGQAVVFEKASELINKLAWTDFYGKQVERVCHYIGGEIDAHTIESIDQGVLRVVSKEEANSLNYVMVDGGMYPMRGKIEPWKEVKIGRIIPDIEILPLTVDRNFIDTSTYVAHLGCAEEFTERVELEIEGLVNLVFICDGAVWIWNWIESLYPNSVQILDFFHAKEHLCEFAKMLFTSESERSAWIEEQCKTWLEGDSEDVIARIKKLDSNIVATMKAKELLVNYYTTNLKRMRYKCFLEKKLFIGSGAIESAHKVFQERFKLSGQHWSPEGLQSTLQLKALEKSRKWVKVINLIKQVQRVA